MSTFLVCAITDAAFLTQGPQHQGGPDNYHYLSCARKQRHLQHTARNCHSLQGAGKQH